MKTTSPVRLVEREHELALLEESLLAAQRGSGRSVVLAGTAGTGKTALLEAAKARAADAGFTLLSTRARIQDDAVRFGVLGRLFEPILPLLDESCRLAVEKLLPNAAGLLPAVAAGGSGTTPASPAELGTLNLALAQLSAGAPVLIAVDELHWSDLASAQWLTALAPRIEGVRVLFLSCLCTGRRHRRTALLDELIETSAVIRPAGLTPPGVAELLRENLGTIPDPEFSAACVTLTGGNPLLLSALGTALSEAKTQPTAAAAADLPDLFIPSLASNLNVRLRRVSEHASTVARAVVVLGKKATIDRIAEVAGADLAAAADIVTALTQIGLLRRSGQYLDFAVPLLRNIVRDDQTFDALQAMHARAARLLRKSRAGAEVVAEHLLATPAAGEPWVAPTMRAAAASALVDGKAKVAVAYLRRALAEPIGESERLRLLTELGRAETYLDPRAAAGHLTEARTATAEPDVDQLLEIAETHATTGRYEQAISSLEPVGDQARRRITAVQAARSIDIRICAAATAETALDDLDRLGREPHTAGLERPWLLSLQAARLAWQGQQRLEVARLADRVFAGRIAPDTMRPCLRAGVALTYAGCLAQALDGFDTLVKAAQEWGHLPALAEARSARSIARRQLGNLTGALEDARAGVDLMRGCGLDLPAVPLHHFARVAQLLSDLHQHDEAMSLLEQARLSGAIPAGRTWPAAEFLVARGRLRIGAGNIAAGIEDLQSAGRLLTAWQVDNPAIAAWRSEAAIGMHALGDTDTARRQVAHDVAAARRWGAAGPLGQALRIQATLQEPDEAEHLLAEGVSLLVGSPARLALGECLLAQGKVMARRDVIAARDVLRAALNVAHECRSPVLAHAARVALAACSGTSASRAWPAVTPAEYLTALLAARGRTDPEIAQALVVQPRTVQSRLDSVYRKLGISTRQELAARLTGPANIVKPGV